MEQEQYYYTKYLKYKAKYLNLIKQTGGLNCTFNKGPQYEFLGS